VEKDRTVPARAAEGILLQRPAAPLRILPGVGHVPMVERPQAFVAALEGILTDLDQDAGGRDRP
jgi:pimeloyl-ACP methyl ester carboxylesterase